MKLLVVTNDFPPRVGGIERYVYEILTRLPDDIVVVTSTSPGAEIFDAACPYRVVRLPTAMLLPTPAVRARVRELARETRPDLVLFGAAMPLGLMGPGLRRRTGVPYAAFTHGTEILAARLPGGRALLRRIFASASLVTAVSAWTAGSLRSCMPGLIAPVVLHNGVDPDRFHPGVSATAAREAFGLGARPVVGCVSRLVRRKGQDAVIRTVQALGRDRPDLACLIVGDGPDASRLRMMADRCGVADRVVFAGAVDDALLPACFAAIDIFAMPCRTRWGGLEVEAFGAVLLQAAAAGRPVVAGRSGGTADAVVDGDTGVLVDGADHAAVTTAIHGLLDAPERAKAMGLRAAARARAAFTWNQIAARARTLLIEAAAASYTSSTSSAIRPHV